MSQDTLYIAEPIYSETLQRFEKDAAFPPIKKIGITTGAPQRREKELLGTVSPVKVAIVKAWNGVDARRVESMLHTILDNVRLDGEYFWDGNETLVDAVSEFMATYHPEAKLLRVREDQDVAAAAAAVETRSSQRMYAEVVPKLESLKLKPRVLKGGNRVRVDVGDYTLNLSARTGGRYTLTIWSKKRTTEEALSDFQGAQELAAHGHDDSDRQARIPMTELEEIIRSIDGYARSIRT